MKSPTRQLVSWLQPPVPMRLAAPIEIAIFGRSCSRDYDSDVAAPEAQRDERARAARTTAPARALALLIAGFCAGCASRGVTADDAGGADRAAGTGGAAASAGTGGASGTGGTATSGTGASAGTGAVAGAGATAGTGGSGGAAGMAGSGTGGAAGGTAGTGGAAGGTAGTGGASGSTAGTGGSASSGTAGCQGHIDCFGRSTCADGVVTQWANMPVSCSAGGCPHGVVGSCRKGCGAAVINGPPSCVLSICRENMPKAAGDPCETDDDCRPVPARTTASTVQNVYLRCDLGMGLCVPGTAPVVADWLAPCTPGIVSSLRGMTTGLMQLTDAACSSGVCMAAGEGSCVRQGCTKGCRSDDECPQGSRCSFSSCDPFETEPTRIGYCAVDVSALVCRT